MAKAYLGDGVYVDVEYGQLVLTTEDGISDGGRAMSLVGWYYLHENGSLIFQRELGDTAADIRESSFAIAMWPIEPDNRECAWNIVVEGLALGADRARVLKLAARWNCTDEDAAVYAEHVGARLFRDGAAWCATRRDFADLQTSAAGFGDTALEALAELCKSLGLKPGKTWNAHFRDLLAAPAPAEAARG